MHAEKKIRILQFTIAASKGGQTQYILNNWRNIDKTRFEFDFVTFSASLNFEDELLRDGCKIYYLSCYPEQNEKLFRDEFAKVLANNYDIIHIHTSFWKGMLVEKMARESGIKKIIIHAHSSNVRGNMEDAEVERKQHYFLREQLSENSATDFWACSSLAAEWLYGERIPKAKIRILFNPVETERFSFDEAKRNCIRSKMKIENEFVIGHVGRLEAVKNHKFLIDVFAELIRKNENVRLWIVGDGSQREEIQKQIQTLHLEDAVTMFGRREDTELLLQGMDCFVMPSVFEGFPISLVESQTAGLPSIVSDVVTREAAVTDYVEYLPLIKERWIARILQLIAENPTRINGQEIVKQAGLDVNTQIKILESLYMEGIC